MIKIIPAACCVVVVVASKLTPSNLGSTEDKRTNAKAHGCSRDQRERDNIPDLMLTLNTWAILTDRDQ